MVWKREIVLYFVHSDCALLQRYAELNGFLHKTFNGLSISLLVVPVRIIVPWLDAFIIVPWLDYDSEAFLGPCQTSIEY